MVGFLGPDRILVALNEELIAYDLQSNHYEHWYEMMTITASASFSIFSAISAVIVPPLESSHYRLSDRQPIAALHVLDDHSVFCVHADGTLHQWTLPSTTTTTSSLRPVAYRPLSTAQVHMPPCDTWDSIAVTAAHYPFAEQWCWIVYLQCTTPVPYTDAATPVSLTQAPTQESPSPHVLLAITGPDDDTTSTSSNRVTTLRLVTPPFQHQEPDVPITHLLLTTPACSLITATTTTTTRTTEWWTYPQGVASSLIQLDAVASTHAFLEHQQQQQYRVLRPNGTTWPPRPAVLQAARERSSTTVLRRQRRNMGR